MAEKSDHDLLTEMHAVLLGTDGSEGLCKVVEKQGKAIIKLWIVITIITTSLGGGIYGIFEVIKNLAG